MVVEKIVEKPVEVIREVVVEKEVFVEKPVEVIKEVIKLVDPTDDLLKTSMVKVKDQNLSEFQHLEKEQDYYKILK